MNVLLHIVLVAGMATVLAAWCGWGVARLALPGSLQHWSGLLAPLLGYCLLIVTGYWIVRDWAGLWVVLAVVLPLAGILNLLAWRRTGPPPLEPRRGHLPILALLAATLLVGVAPLISYGYPAIVGGNWDVENYLPTARYLERGPVSAMPSAPPNPLRDLNATPPRIGLTLGFSIWQGSIDLLTNSEAISTFVIVLAWLRMMGVAAVYVLFRSVMGLTRGYALLGAAFVSAGALLLWVELFNFGMQMAAWPLIPLGLVVGISAVEDASRRKLRRAWPVLVGAGLALAALPVAYYPALTLFGPLALGLGLAVLWRSKSKVQMLIAVVLMGLVSLLFALPTIGAYFEGFSFRYGEQLTTLGLFRYVPLTDFAGLTPFELRAPRDATAPIEAWVGLAALALLMLVGLAFGRGRWKWVGLALGAAGYMAWLRWGQEYPYAYMKGGAYASFPFLGLAAAGLQSLANYELRITNDGLGRRFQHFAVALVGLGLLLPMGLAQSAMLDDFMGRPRLYTTQMPDLLSLRAQIPPGSRVTYTSDPRIDTVTNGLAAYMLDHTTMLGSAQTGYSPPWSNGEPDDVGDFGLLSFQEDPTLRGFSPEGRVWQGGSFVLYRRPEDVKAHLTLDRILQPGERLTLSLGENDLSTGDNALKGGEQRRIRYSLASFAPISVRFSGDVQWKFEGGGVTLTTPVLNTPRSFTLYNEGEGPLTVTAASLIEPGQPTGQPDTGTVKHGRTTVLAHAASSMVGGSVTTRIDALAPNVGPVVLELDIWDTPRGLHYGSYAVEQPRVDVSRSFTLTLALTSGSATATDEKGAPLPLGATFEGLTPGDYAARLNIKAGTRLLATSDDVFTFSVREDGTILSPEVQTIPVLATAADRPLVPLADVLIGDDVQLLGYALGDRETEPGGKLSITLWWKVLAGGLDERSILLHLRDALGEKKAQGDGPPAGGGRPTSTWQEGEIVIDHHTIDVPADLPDGTYNLAVGMYRFPSLEPLSLVQAGESLEGNVLLVPVQVKR